MSAPLRKNESDALHAMSRTVTRTCNVEETLLTRLIALGLVEDARGTIEITMRGRTTLQRRKSLARGAR